MEVNSATITITTSSVNAQQDVEGLDEFCTDVERLAAAYLAKSNVTVEMDIKRRRLARLRSPDYDITRGDRALSDELPPAPPLDRHGG